MEELNKYRCSTCTRVDCSVWVGGNLKLAQEGKMTRTHYIVAVSEAVGLCCHSTLQSKLPDPLDVLKAWVEWMDCGGASTELQVLLGEKDIGDSEEVDIYLALINGLKNNLPGMISMVKQAGFGDLSW